MSEQNEAEFRARIVELRDGAAIRLPMLTGESAATARGWVAAMDEVLAQMDTTPPSAETAAGQGGAG